MHFPEVVKNNPLGDRQSFYENNIQGCVDFYGGTKGIGSRCLSNEAVRVKMSLRQPKSVFNYTETGYTKIRAPDEVMELLTEFWNNNNDKARQEKWGKGYVRDR